MEPLILLPALCLITSVVAPFKPLTELRVLQIMASVGSIILFITPETTGIDGSTQLIFVVLSFICFLLGSYGLISDSSKVRKK